MKPLLAFAVASVGVLSALDLASAASFSPLMTKFKLTGTVNYLDTSTGATATCSTGVWTGHTTKGHGRARFSLFQVKNIRRGCNETPEDAPWQVVTAGPGAATIENSHFSGSLPTVCGGNIPVSISSNGVWSFQTKNGSCMMTGSMQSTPPVTVAP